MKKALKIGNLVIAKARVYDKGVLNIPRIILEVSKINKNSEVTICARENEILICPNDNQDTSFIEKFLESLKNGLPRPDNWKIVQVYNSIILGLKNSDIRTSIHLSIVEQINNVKQKEFYICINGGIKQFLDTDEEIRKVDENLKRIRETLKRYWNTELVLTEDGNGYIITREPKFDYTEVSLISSILSLLLYR